MTSLPPRGSVERASALALRVASGPPLTEAEIAEALVELAHDPSPACRIQWWNALVRSPASPAATAHAVATVARRDADLRGYAAVYLRGHAPAALAALAEVLADDIDPRVRYALAEAAADGDEHRALLEKIAMAHLADHDTYEAIEQDLWAHGTARHLDALRERAKADPDGPCARMAELLAGKLER